MGYPDRNSEHRILTTQPRAETLKPVLTGDEVVALQDRVPEDSHGAGMVDYILDLVEATRNDEQLHLGVSPRGCAGVNGGFAVGGDGAIGAIRDAG